MYFRCNGCGGNVVFDPNKKKMVCESCSTESAYQMIQQENLRKCDNCGAILEPGELTLSFKCPSCDTHLILNDRMAMQYKPDLVLPFAVSKYDAIDLLNESFGKKLFLPGNFLNASTVEHIQGVYVPFWMFDFHTNVDYSAKGEKIRTWTSGDTEYTETQTYQIERKFDIDYDKIPADGSTMMEDDLMDLLEPFAYEELVDFEPQFLSGFLTDVYDEDAASVQPRAEEKVAKYVKQKLDSTISGYDAVRTEFDHKQNNVKETKYAFLPMWRYVYSYAGKEYHFFVNGQTGKVTGAPPISKKKAVGLGLTTFASIFFCLQMIFNFLGVL